VKRLVTLVVPAILVAAAVAASVSARPAATPPTMHPGQLVVGFDPPAVGFVSGTVRGSTIVNPKGYEVDIAAAIAAGLGLKPVWIRSPWTKLFAPGSKDFDISFQEATITAQRNRTVDFSTPYFNANQGVLISRNTTAPKSLAELRKLQTCAQTDTTGLDWIKSKLHPSKAPLIYQTTVAAFTAVHVNRCQALILDVPIIASEKKARPSAYGAVAGQAITNEKYGGVLPNNSKLKPMVDAQITKLWENGKIQALQKKWFAIDFTKIPVLK
jgi:polar amino acid transport system substrate-binding protein